MPHHLSRCVEVASELTTAKEANARFLIEVARLKKAIEANKRAVIVVKEVVEAPVWRRSGPTRNSGQIRTRLRN